MFVFIKEEGIFYPLKLWSINFSYFISPVQETPGKHFVYTLYNILHNLALQKGILQGKKKNVMTSLFIQIVWDKLQAKKHLFAYFNELFHALSNGIRMGSHS